MNESKIHEDMDALVEMHVLQLIDDLQYTKYLNDD